MAPLILTLGTICSERQNLLPGRFTPGKEPTVKVRVNDSHKRPGVAQRVPVGLGSQISMTFGT